MLNSACCRWQASKPLASLIANIHNFYAIYLRSRQKCAINLRSGAKVLAFRQKFSTFLIKFSHYAKTLRSAILVLQCDLVTTTYNSLLQKVP